MTLTYKASKFETCIMIINKMQRWSSCSIKPLKFKHRI